jgi:hypothetical protein
VTDIPITIGNIAIDGKPIVTQPVPNMLPPVIPTAPPVKAEMPSAPLAHINLDDLRMNDY